MAFVKRYELQPLFLLGRHLAQVLNNLPDEDDDVGGLHLQAQVVGVDLAVFHELVHHAQQAAGGSAGGLLSRRVPAVLAELIDGTLDDGQWRAELMGDVGEQFHAEVVQLAFHVHLLVQTEPLTGVAPDIQ